jgi:hypothetical protein
MIGFSIWWYTVPEPLLYKPDALASPDLKFLVDVVKDTYEYNICSTHHLPSPCECGEPINQTAKDMFSETYAFDPFDFNKIQRINSYSIYLSSILLSLLLSESISQYGILESII